MKVYSVGPDEPGEASASDFGNAVWLVVWYEAGDYEGSGEGVSFDGTTCTQWDFGHCSCYGPFDDEGRRPARTGTPEEILADADSIHDSRPREEVAAKVRGLLAADAVAGCPLIDAPACVVADWYEDHGRMEEAGRVRAGGVL